MRTALAIAVAAAAAALLVPAAGADARTRYCSPSGDYCKATYKREGRRTFELRTAALFSPPRGYRLCVRDPEGVETCRKFRLRRARFGFFSVVTWSAHFPTNGGPGRYRVRWDDGGVSYGPPLSFRRR